MRVVCQYSISEEEIVILHSRDVENLGPSNVFDGYYSRVFYLRQCAPGDSHSLPYPRENLLPDRLLVVQFVLPNNDHRVSTLFQFGIVFLVFHHVPALLLVLWLNSTFRADMPPAPIDEERNLLSQDEVGRERIRMSGFVSEDHRFTPERDVPTVEQFRHSQLKLAAKVISLPVFDRRQIGASARFFEEPTPDELSVLTILSRQ